MRPGGCFSSLRHCFLERPACFVLTSASISIAESLRHFVDGWPVSSSGTVGDLHTELFPSPFDFGGRCGLYCPDQMPAPDHPEFRMRFDDEVMDLLDLSGGGAFLLFTSYRAMQAAKDRLAHRLLLRGIQTLTQGEQPKMTLLADFKTASENGSAVLFATHSFWQGVDVQGKALRLRLDCLPFKPPVEPLQRAKANGFVASSVRPLMSWRFLRRPKY